MAQLISVRLQRSDNAPWGFRLQGGKDFGAPLVIQKVNGNSIAENAGLQAGDAVLRVNSTDVFNLRHKEAQDTIVRAGQNFEITIQRGSQTWKPAVVPTGNLPAPSPTFNNVTPVTKTSLAASRPQSQLIGSGHNTQAKPFLNGNSDHGKLVNKQYNCPIGLYSEESIAETLSAQTEVLPTGALGVNFKKNERSYDANKSEVLKLLQEAESEPRDIEPETEHQGVVSSPAPVNVAGLRHVTAPIAPPPSSQANKPLQPGQNICADCERLIIGVFVRIKDKNLHVECFKCSTCGSSLKNVGYYNINNKLYCDIHAKLAARSNQPAPNMVPVTIPPGGKIPVGTISAALASRPLPAVAPLSPSSNSSGPLPPYSPASSVLSGPRPFSSNAAPLSPLSPISAPSSGVPSFNTHAATLPRAAPAQGQPGRYSTLKPAFNTNFKGAGVNNNVGGLRPIGAAGAGGIKGKQAGAVGIAPRRGRGILNKAASGGTRVPLCGQCNGYVRGPFITALGKIWCPDHFMCATPSCRRPLQDLGFVEENGQLYCEFCFEQYLAPACDHCHSKVKGDCLKAIGKHFHPECFTCDYCGKLFGNNPFFLEDGKPYCEADWNELFTTKCFACGYPVEAGDRWVEALNNNYHSQCFNCTMCKKNLEGQSFYAKGGRPFCKNHAR